MNVIFLDIDGVLNYSGTKEKLWNGCDGISLRHLKLFNDYIAPRDIKLVLSSTWRNHPGCLEVLKEHGLEFVAATPRGRIRGEEIQAILIYGYIDKYAILDDLDPGSFLPNQRPFLVQTSYVYGLRPRNLKQLDKILIAR